MVNREGFLFEVCIQVRAGKSTRIFDIVVNHADMSLRNGFNSFTCQSLRSRIFVHRLVHNVCVYDALGVGVFVKCAA